MNTRFIGYTPLTSKHAAKADKHICLLNVPCNPHFITALYILHRCMLWKLV